MSDKPINDLHIIQRLRSQIEQLENLEKRINTLEQERSTLTHTTECLQAELIRHQQIKADWEWFLKTHSIYSALRHLMVTLKESILLLQRH
ncbi:hypothetical protein LFREDSHE_13710 [Shewanella baltica]